VNEMSVQYTKELSRPTTILAFLQWMHDTLRGAISRFLNAGKDVLGLEGTPTFLTFPEALAALEAPPLAFGADKRIWSGLSESAIKSGPPRPRKGSCSEIFDISTSLEFEGLYEGLRSTENLCSNRRCADRLLEEFGCEAHLSEKGSP